MKIHVVGLLALTFTLNSCSYFKTRNQSPPIQYQAPRGIVNSTIPPTYQAPNANLQHNRITTANISPSTPIQVNTTQKPILVTPKRIHSITPPPMIAPVTRPQVAPRTSNQSYGNTVRLVNGLAIAPPHAPLEVKKAVAAGNKLQSLPYKFGGGHAQLNDNGYDCSGAVSYVLRNAGLMKGATTSTGFTTYGQSGKGKWITVYARGGHVFMTIGGLRLDARGASRPNGGPRWLEKSRSTSGFKVRNPSGL